jgi:hypothetical protein
VHSGRDLETCYIRVGNGLSAVANNSPNFPFLRFFNIF